MCKQGKVYIMLCSGAIRDARARYDARYEMCEVNKTSTITKTYNETKVWAYISYYLRYLSNAESDDYEWYDDGQVTSDQLQYPLQQQMISTEADLDEELTTGSASTCCAQPDLEVERRLG